nr:hypothetical protein [Cryobacterium cheniae]
MFPHADQDRGGGAADGRGLAGAGGDVEDHREDVVAALVGGAVVSFEQRPFAG